MTIDELGDFIQNKPLPEKSVPLVLITYQGSLRQRTSWRYYLIQIAIQRGHLPTIEWLFDNGIDINERCNFSETPLMMAAAAGHIKVVAFLLDKGADATLVDDFGNTAIDWVKTSNSHAWYGKSMIALLTEPRSEIQFSAPRALLPSVKEEEVKTEQALPPPLRKMPSVKRIPSLRALLNN